MHVDYDSIAPTYDRRYAANPLQGIAAALLALAQETGAGRMLEVGCGTGRWLAELQPHVRHISGLDLSPGMLRQARRRPQPFSLVCGQASQLPFPAVAFDLVYCVHAFHHFDRKRDFLSEARRLLKPGGALAIAGFDPHSGLDRWYLYDYFDGTYEIDLRRYPSQATIREWMVAAGFDAVESRMGERTVHALAGREVLEDPFLQKNGTSQLALLTDGAYAAGIERIRTALREAEAAGKTMIFPVDISFPIVIGRVAG